MQRLAFIVLALVLSFLNALSAEGQVVFKAKNEGFILDAKNGMKPKPVSLDYSADSKQMLVGFAGRTPEIWTTVGEKLLGKIPVEITDAATEFHCFWSSDGKFIVVASADQESVRFQRYEISTQTFSELTKQPLSGRLQRIVKLESDRFFLMLLDKEGQMAVAIVDNAGEATKPLDFKNQKNPIVNCSGSSAVFAATDGTTVKVFDAKGKLYSQFVPKDVGRITALAISPDDSYLAVIGLKEMQIVDLKDKRVVFKFSQAGTTHTAAFSSDGRFVFGLWENGLWIYNVGDGKYVSDLGVDPGTVVAFSQGGKCIATIGVKDARLINCWTLSIELKESVRPKAPLVAAEEPAPEKAKPMIPAVKHRIWTSADGKFTVVAELVDVVGDEVQLKRRDTGALLKLPKAGLSKADQSFLEKRNP